jgi:hypothetical protein
MSLRNLAPGENPDPGAYVIEYDVTPGLREWIGEQISVALSAAAPGSTEERWCISHQKILDDHTYTTNVVAPNYGPHSAPFGCERCHDWDGVTAGYGNCATLLALAEGYGLDDEDSD